MRVGHGRALVLGLANEEALGRFWLRDCEGSWGQLGSACLCQVVMERFWAAHRTPSGHCVRVGQGIILLLFLLGSGWGAWRA